MVDCTHTFSMKEGSCDVRFLDFPNSLSNLEGTSKNNPTIVKQWGGAQL